MKKITVLLLLGLTIFDSCSTAKNSLQTSNVLHERISELNTFLNVHLPGSALSTTHDQDGNNTLVVLVNLSQDNLPRWSVTARLIKFQAPENRLRFFYKAARSISNYILAYTIQPDDNLTPHLVVAFYTDRDSTITWYNYLLEEKAESRRSDTHSLDIIFDYHKEWTEYGPSSIQKPVSPQSPVSESSPYMIALTTRTLR